MSERTKTLPPGYPVVGDNGAITCMTIDEIAKRVGKQLGVQQRHYSIIAGGKWYRLASFGSNSFCSAILFIGHKWSSGNPSGLTVAINNSAPSETHNRRITQLSGVNGTVQKIRIVSKHVTSDVGEAYLDIFINESKKAGLYIGSFSNGGIELTDSLQEAPSIDGMLVSELTTTNMGGGKTFVFKRLQNNTEFFDRFCRERRAA